MGSDVDSGAKPRKTGRNSVPAEHRKASAQRYGHCLYCALRGPFCETLRAPGHPLTILRIHLHPLESVRFEPGDL